MIIPLPGEEVWVWSFVLAAFLAFLLPCGLLQDTVICIALSKFSIQEAQNELCMLITTTGTDEGSLWSFMDHAVTVSQKHWTHEISRRVKTQAKQKYKITWPDTHDQINIVTAPF